VAFVGNDDIEGVDGKPLPKVLGKAKKNMGPKLLRLPPPPMAGTRRKPLGGK
jgi:hypothetical protein